MYGVLPYGSSIDRITIKGIFLRKTLEISAGKFSPDGENEGVGFPQVRHDHYYLHSTFLLSTTREPKVLGILEQER